MLISKAFKKTLLSCYALFFLAACNLPAPKDKDEAHKGNTSATFSAQAKADGSKATETAVAGNFSLPSSKIFNFQACLNDIAYDKPIAGHDFIIEELNQTVTSDKSGCVSWPEKIEFNFLADSQYIRINRHIIGKGFHKGSQLVSYAVNPWSHGDSLPAVLDPNDNKIEKLITEKEKISLALKGYSTDNKQIVRPLWVEDARLFVTEQKLSADGLVLNVELRATPSIKMTKMNGDIFFRPLSTGKFNTDLKIIHNYSEKDKDIRRILAKASLTEINMKNGSLVVKTSIKLPLIPTRGQVMLGIELNPLNGPPGLKTFEGVYLLGEYDQLKGPAFLKVHSAVTEKEDFKIANFATNDLNDIATDKEKNKIISDTYQKPKIEISQLVFSFLPVGRESTSKREFMYNIKACLNHGLDQKNIRAQTFKVTKFRRSEKEVSQTIPIKTDHNSSCINWVETFTYNYFEGQHYFKGYVQIENPDLGLNEKIEIALNPWDKYNLDAKDMRFLEPSNKLRFNCENNSCTPSRIKIPGYSYSKNSFRYVVDKYLNLTVIKKVQLILEPRLLMYSSLSAGRDASEKLRDGFYLLKTAVIQNKDYDTENTYITSDEKLVTVTDGRIDTNITFQIQDLKALGNTNNFLVEIYPVDEAKIEVKDGSVKLKNQNASLDSAIDTTTGLISPTYIGSILINNDVASMSLRLLESDSLNEILLSGKANAPEQGQSIIQAIVNEGKKKSAQKAERIQQLATKEIFAKENNLDFVSLAKADTKAPLLTLASGKTRLNEVNIVTKPELELLLDIGKLTSHTAHKLCAFWALDFFKMMIPEKGGAVNGRASSGFMKNCIKGVQKDTRTFFKVEKHLRINEVGEAEYLKGYSDSIPVGSSFSLSKSHSETDSSTHTLGFKFGIAKRFFQIFEGGGGYSYSMSWATSDSDSATNSISVSNSTSLNMLQKMIKVPVKSHEECAIVTLNPSLFIKDEERWFGLLPRRDYLGILNPRLTDEEVTAATTRGLLICSGEVRKEPKEIIENYYLISQEPPSQGHDQDGGDARNRNFFITLRSKNDYKRFLLGVKGAAGTPETSAKEEDSHEQFKKKLEQIFLLPGPAYPGVYLINKSSQ